MSSAENCHKFSKTSTPQVWKFELMQKHYGLFALPDIDLDSDSKPVTQTKFGYQGCARFPEFVQNFSEPDYVDLCSVIFLAFTLKLPIQTSLSVAPTRSVFWRAIQFQENKHTPDHYCTHFWD